MNFADARTLLAATSLCLLAACGGNRQDQSDAGSPETPPTVSGTTETGTATNKPASPETPPVISGAIETGTAPSKPASAAITPAAAARFLSRASFGPTMSSIGDVASGGREAWLTAQFGKRQILHRAYIDSITASGARADFTQVYESFWQQTANGDDQLRQRMAFALSEIFVISMQNEFVRSYPRGVASYYDMLGKHAFGNFRDLLEGVALHPMMGIYLSHMHNQEESGDRVPDENFAREVMQLFTIGLYQLNPDGSYKMSAAGQPVNTYQDEDVKGLAKVFTGWSWAGPDQSQSRFFGSPQDAQSDWQTMQNYPAFHSSGEKNFLGVSISSATSGAADLKVALDTLFNHPNVGPFIGRQLIQRLVTSNPSPAYVQRVAAAFANNGAGVRGDMKAVIRAVLLDRHADDPGTAALAPEKLREPVVRLANWMRAFNAKSTSGRYLLYYLDDPLYGLGQSPLYAPSVFNFFRPGYMPPNSGISGAGLVAPEMQITGEPTVTGYLNFMQNAIANGAGNGNDVKADYSAELALAAEPEKLLDRVNLLLLNGMMSATLRQQILMAVNSVSLPVLTAQNAAQLSAAKTNRVRLAVFLTMASPEYIVQK